MTEPTSFRECRGRFFAHAATSLVALAAAAMVGLLAGCSTHLAGMNDAALEYGVAPESGGPAPVEPRSAATLVKARLTTAQIAADVDVAGNRVRVVVDADTADAVNAFILWRGGVAFYRANDGFALTLPAPEELRRVAGSAGNGAAGPGDGGWRGSSAAVARALRNAKLDDRHVVFAERVDDGEWRTRAFTSARRPRHAAFGDHVGRARTGRPRGRAHPRPQRTRAASRSGAR